jgi:hypothetical protein
LGGTGFLQVTLFARTTVIMISWVVCVWKYSGIYYYFILFYFIIIIIIVSVLNWIEVFGKSTCPTVKLGFKVCPQYNKWLLLLLLLFIIYFYWKNVFVTVFQVLKWCI